MAQVFKGDDIGAIFDGECPKGFPKDILAVARRKIAMVKAAKVITDLKSPPGNKPHPLVDDRDGQWAIWISGKYRLCFKWTENGAADLEITDYH